MKEIIYFRNYSILIIFRKKDEQKKKLSLENCLLPIKIQARNCFDQFLPYDIVLDLQ